MKNPHAHIAGDLVGAVFVGALAYVKPKRKSRSFVASCMVTLLRLCEGWKGMFIPVD